MAITYDRCYHIYTRRLITYGVTYYFLLCNIYSSDSHPKSNGARRTVSVNVKKPVDIYGFVDFIGHTGTPKTMFTRMYTHKKRWLGSKAEFSENAVDQAS